MFSRSVPPLGIDSVRRELVGLAEDGAEDVGLDAIRKWGGLLATARDGKAGFADQFDHLMRMSAWSFRECLIWKARLADIVPMRRKREVEPFASPRLSGMFLLIPRTSCCCVLYSAEVESFLPRIPERVTLI